MPVTVRNVAFVVPVRVTGGKEVTQVRWCDFMLLYILFLL